jgi:phospholipid transport system substrate-binding protein
MKKMLDRGPGTRLLAIILFLCPVLAGAGAPGTQIRQTVGELLAALQDPSLKGEASKQERRKRLKEVIYPRFDFAEMAKRSLGKHWQQRTPEEQEEFVKLFTSLLEASYLNAIESYNGEKVQFLRERQDQGLAEVETKIVDGQGKEFSVNYRLHSRAGDWKVYDVMIENISLVNNYRSQFNRVLGKSSYRDLVLAMKEKKISSPAPRS